MKKGVILNSEISAVIATMGHTDMLCVADSGLPIASTTKRIDISLMKGVPGFLQTLDAILEELEVEEAIIATEMAEVSPDLCIQMKKILGNIPLRLITHEEFKTLTKGSKACVRTGECTPYANIILKSGVTF